MRRGQGWSVRVLEMSAEPVVAVESMVDGKRRVLCELVVYPGGFGPSLGVWRVPETRAALWHGDPGMA